MSKDGCRKITAMHVTLNVAIIIIIIVLNIHCINFNNNYSWLDKNTTCFCESPEGVKWELGFAYFSTGKMGLGSLGLGITNSKLGMVTMSTHCTSHVVHAQ